MEYGVVNELGLKITNYFSSSEFASLLSTIKTITIFTSILYVLTFIPTLFMIYKKEGIKPWLAFIPIVNLYPLFKLIDIPYYLVFIPIINIIVLYIMPYKITKAYNMRLILKILSFIFPYVEFILIGFTTKYHLTRKKDIRYLKTVADVDKVEEHLENIQEGFYEERGNYQENPINASYKSSVDDKITNIEQNAIQDDFYEDLLQLEDNGENKKEIKQQQEEVIDEEIVDDVGMQDLFDNSDIRVNKLDQIDTKIEESSKKEIIDNAEYKDYKGKDVSVSTIAFGGAEQIEKIEKAKTDSKDSNMKCPKCGSQLIVNNKVCPGCGKDVSDIIYENQGLTKVKL